MLRANTLVVDDDKLWQKSISKLVLLSPILNLVGTCSSAMEAYAKIVENDIDLIICDIEMPEMSGIDFIKSIKNPPLVIFITSHRDYALDCYEVSPVDFLLKPFDISRFLSSIEKVRLRLDNPPDISTIQPYLFVRENHNYIQIAYKDIQFMMAEDNFLKIVTPNQNFLPILTISKMEQFLKGDTFMRVHRSFLVNREHIKMLTKDNVVLNSGKKIPIGDQYRNQINRKHIEGNLVSRNK